LFDLDRAGEGERLSWSAASQPVGASDLTELQIRDCALLLFRRFNDRHCSFILSQQSRYSDVNSVAEPSSYCPQSTVHCTVYTAQCSSHNP